MAARTHADVYHSLSVMLAAGLPLLRALQTVTAGLRGRLAAVFRTVAGDIERGDPPAEAMAKHPKAFGPLDVLMVEVGHTSGNLAEYFEDLSTWHRFRYRLRGIILSGLMLPLVLIHAAALIIPAPNLILGRMDAVQYLLSVIGTLAIFYIPAACILAVVYLTPKTGLLRSTLDAMVIWIPVLGGAVLHLGLSRYSRASHMLYKAGTSLVQCCEAAAGVVGNTKVRSWLDGGTQSARAGGPVSAGLSSRLPLEFIETWRTGEEAGAMEDVTARLAANSADIAEHRFTELARWLPRIVYFIVCIFLSQRESWKKQGKKQ